MRLLICTQAVDPNDSDLGFFVRWIEEFAKTCDHVTVICLREGVYALPKNVEVIVLGEHNRLWRACKVCTISFGHRNEYDAVFVHMNPEYIIVAGWLWRLLSKKIGLWYVHKSVNTRLRIATFFANYVFTASKESFRLATSKLHIFGHGIDTVFFAPDPTIARSAHLLSAGRLTKSKNHDHAIRAAAKVGRALRIAGEGPERAALEKVAEAEGGDVRFLGGLTQVELQNEYRGAAYFIHASTTGSLDKVVLEALATNCPVITTNESLSVFPVLVSEATPDAIAKTVRNNPDSPPQSAEYVRMYHSLPHLIQSICKQFVSKNAV